MEHYQTIMSYAYILCLVLVGAIVVASLYKTRRSYRIALGCYSVVALVAALTLLAPITLGILMANSFHSSNKVGLIGYLIPLLTLIGFIYPALSLYPFMHGRGGWIVAFVFAGLTVGLAILSFVRDALRWPLNQEGYMYFQRGAFAIFHLLLWLRVYDLRAASETETETE